MMNNKSFFLGFTGTRNGMSELQKRVVSSILSSHHIHCKVFALHGDCVGADEDFYDLATKHNFVTVAYPPINNKYRAFTRSKHVKEPQEYLERDRWIVHDAHFLIGCPNNFEPVKGSGTWYTINHAKITKTDHVIVYPTGATEKVVYETKPDTEHYPLF